MATNVKHNAMCTNDENPNLMDAKMFLFHVEGNVGWGPGGLTPK